MNKMEPPQRKSSQSVGQLHMYLYVHGCVFVCMQVPEYIHCFFYKSCNKELNSKVSRNSREEKGKDWFIGTFM